MKDQEYEVDFMGWSVIVVITYLYNNHRPDSISDIGWDVVSAVHDDEEDRVYDGFSFDERSCTADFSRAVLEVIQGSYSNDNWDREGC